MSQAHAVAAEADVDHAPFVRSTNPEESSFVEGRERGELPRIESEHVPALRSIFGMGEAEWTPCPIPGHRGSASLDESERGLALWCDCLGGRQKVTVTLRGTYRPVDVDLGPVGPHSYALSEVYFAVKTGTKLERGFRTRYRDAYALLLHAELGLIEQASVRRLLPSLSERSRSVASLFDRLYAAQVGERVYADGHREPGFPDPGALAVGLVGEWCGCSQGAAHDAIRELVDGGVIVRCGRRGRAFLYRPCAVVVPIRAEARGSMAGGELGWAS